MRPVSPDPHAPLVVDELPDFWDRRRAREDKPDLSRCGAELRAALMHKQEPPAVYDAIQRLETVASTLNAIAAVLAAPPVHDHPICSQCGGTWLVGAGHKCGGKR